MTIYHAANDATPTVPLCEEMRQGDVVVALSELNTADLRHFNCVACHKALTDGQRHVDPGGIKL